MVFKGLFDGSDALKVVRLRFSFGLWLVLGGLVGLVKEQVLCP